MCYSIKDEKNQERFSKRTVTVSNQFGQRELNVRTADTLCVPSEKEEVSSTLALDHFKCYKSRTAKGESRFEPRILFLSDQFESKNIKVSRPVTLCNPVDKDGSGIGDPEGHLVCYDLKEVKGEKRLDRRDVLVENQFGDLILSARQPDSLCVPSTKFDGEE